MTHWRGINWSHGFFSPITVEHLSLSLSCCIAACFLPKIYNNSIGLTVILSTRCISTEGFLALFCSVWYSALEDFRFGLIRHLSGRLRWVYVINFTMRFLWFRFRSLRYEGFWPWCTRNALNFLIDCRIIFLYWIDHSLKKLVWQVNRCAIKFWAFNNALEIHLFTRMIPAFLVICICRWCILSLLLLWTIREEDVKKNSIILFCSFEGCGKEYVVRVKPWFSHGNKLGEK